MGRSNSRSVNTQALWRELHTYAPKNVSNWRPLAAMKAYHDWVQKIPRSKDCLCDEHWIILQKECPPVFDTAIEYFEWGYYRHDDVSRLHSGAPRISLDDAYAMYWPDAIQN